jgi:hypothetical protein
LLAQQLHHASVLVNDGCCQRQVEHESCSHGAQLQSDGTVHERITVSKLFGSCSHSNAKYLSRPHFFQHSSRL